MLPKRDIRALVEALRIRALALTGEKWERTATRDMMNEAADRLEELTALGAGETPHPPTAHTLTLRFGRFLTEAEWREIAGMARTLPFVVEMIANAVTEGVAAPPAVPQLEGTIDMQLLAWAVSNCHTLARRELNRLRPYVNPDTLAIERWEHVLRICEKAGARSKGVLRASLPTELTEEAAVPAQPDVPCVNCGKMQQAVTQMARENRSLEKRIVELQNQLAASSQESASKARHE